MKVTWRDAQHTTDSVPDWLDTMDCICETVGFFVAEDKIYLTIARDRYRHSCTDRVKAADDATEDFSCFIRIPKAVILKRETRL